MKKILFFLPVLLLLQSCTEELIEKPKAVAVETFYNTASEVEAAVNAAYAQLRATNGVTGQLGAQLEAYTDYSYGRGSYQVLIFRASIAPIFHVPTRGGGSFTLAFVTRTWLFRTRPGAKVLVRPT
jgi:hypothetical protein